MKRARANKAGIEAFVDRQGESSERIGDGRVEKGVEGAETAARLRGSQKTLEDLRLVGKISGERAKMRAERIHGGAEMKAREKFTVFLTQKMAVENFSLMERELKKINGDLYGLKVILQLTQKGHDRSKKRLIENNALTERLREAAEAEK